MPGTQEMQVRSLEEEMASHSSILTNVPWTEEPGSHSPWGHKESDVTEHTCTFKKVPTTQVYPTIVIRVIFVT